MSLYQRPLQPWDPIVQDQQIKPPVRFIRDNFQGTGQDSHTQPPAQDPSMWQALTNVQPITKGVIERRWGFNQFASGLDASINRLYSFQRDSDGLRTILATGINNIQAIYENGTIYNSNVYTPQYQGAGFVRALQSRNYAYFYDGNQLDLKKWNGDNQLTNWGINIGNVTTNQSGGGTVGTAFGPLTPNTAQDVVYGAGSTAWANIIGIEGNTSFATNANNTTGNTDFLWGSQYGFNLGSPTAVLGIQVTVTAKSGSNNHHPYITAFLTANNAFTYTAPLWGSNSAKGVTKSANINTTQNTYTFGGSTDLWGTTWSPGDISGDANFGVVIQGRQDVGTAGTSFSIQNVQVTVWVQISGTSTNSGSGVGILGTAAGSVNLTLGRTYYLALKNDNTGHYSDISPPSASTGPLLNQQINLILATGNDPQVTSKTILATADGNDPSILYQVPVTWASQGGFGAQTTPTTTIPNGVTQVTDNTPDPTLVLQQALLFTDQSGSESGLALNTPPPAGTMAIKHQGRIWMAGVAGATHSIYFSKGITDLTLPNGFIAGKYEEAWPASNYMDISDGAEAVSGLLSDGQTLYIGSQYHVRRVTGNDPTNFSLPEIVHPQVGVINQECWQIVYTQGSPAGAVWMTPDFRVIQSDFNTYVDIGTRIQDILNNLQPTAPSLTHAAFVADGEYDLYVLSVPYLQSTFCDTHLIYDMRHQQWFVWQPTGGSLALLYNVTAAALPQWLFVPGTSGSVNQYAQTALTDNGTAFTMTAKTSWLGLGEPGQRKVLNEIDYDGDPAMTLSINGALLQSDFNTPLVMTTNMASALGPLGTRKYFVAGSAIKSRYFQLVFSTNSTVSTILGAYNIESVPFTDL